MFIMNCSAAELMYFDETSGSRKTGKIRLTLDHETYTLMFKPSGTAAHGVYEGYLCCRGVIQKADKKAKYEVKTVDDKDYLVNTSGKVQKKGRYKDRDGEIWQVVSGSESSGYHIVKE